MPINFRRTQKIIAGPATAELMSSSGTELFGVPALSLFEVRRKESEETQCSQCQYLREFFQKIIWVGLIHPIAVHVPPS